MKAKEPWRVKTGRTLAPSTVAQNLRALQSDIADSMSKRYTYSTLVLDFSGLTNASAAGERLFSFTTLNPYDIVGMELDLYSAVDADFTLATVTITGAGVSGQETITAAPAGATTKVSTKKNFTAAVTGTTAVTFTLSVQGAGGAYTISSLKCKVHIRSDRGSVPAAAHVPYAIAALPNPGDVVARAPLNTEFAAAATASAANTANDKCTRMEVYLIRNISTAAGASFTDFHIPDDGRRLQRLSAGICSNVANTWRFDMLNASAVSQANVSVTGTGTANHVTADGTPVSASQPGSGLGTANDWILRVSHTSGASTGVMVYCVIYWS